MTRKRKTHTPAFKAQVALTAVKGDRTINEVALAFEVHPTLIHTWKKQLHQGAESIFASGTKPIDNQAETITTELYEQIGRLKMDLEWLKKNSLASVECSRRLIEEGHPTLSIRRQCELLGLNRSSLYYEAVPETEENLMLMGLIDRQYTDCPFYGSRRMAAWLRRVKGYDVNRKRIQRLMGVMGLEAIYPKRNLSAPDREHKVYPYLLRDVKIERPDQVWSTDITYIGLPGGFMYLAAVIDWYSRCVLAWRLSNTLDGEFCLEMLEEALAQGSPEVFNTDQGSQFTARAWTGRLESAGVKVSMDGKGRCLDNVFVERLWRTVKYENVYLRRYETVPLLREGMEAYFPFYNEERLHQSLGYLTPGEVYRQGKRVAG